MTPSVKFPPIGTIAISNLILRPITLKDLPDYYELCSDEEVMRTWGTPHHRSLDDTRRLIFFLQESYRAEQMVRWAITEKGSDEMVGDVGFWRFVKERCRAEIGAKLKPKYWNRGFMSDGLSAVIQFGFEKMGLHTVEANVDPLNRAALRLVEKVGFVREGVVREHSYNIFENKFKDTALFSVVKTTFTAARKAHF